MQKFLVRSLFLVLLLSAAESWALPPCPSDTGVIWTNCYGTYMAEGEKYVGRAESILKKRAAIKQRTVAERRLQHAKAAA